MKKTIEIRYVQINYCGMCPHRKMDKIVVNGTLDMCEMNGRNLDYRVCLKRGEFPKGCPLPILKEKP